jgi:hypothetical protein
MALSLDWAREAVEPTTGSSWRQSSDQLIPWTENTEISNITRTSPAFA